MIRDVVVVSLLVLPSITAVVVAFVDYGCLVGIFWGWLDGWMVGWLVCSCGLLVVRCGFDSYLVGCLLSCAVMLLVGMLFQWFKYLPCWFVIECWLLDFVFELCMNFRGC